MEILNTLLKFFKTFLNPKNKKRTKNQELSFKLVYLPLIKKSDCIDTNNIKDSQVNELIHTYNNILEKHYEFIEESTKHYFYNYINKDNSKKALAKILVDIQDTYHYLARKLGKSNNFLWRIKEIFRSSHETAVIFFLLVFVALVLVYCFRTFFN